MRPLLASQTDDRLVALTRAGNERAFDAIVHRYRAPLVRYAGRFLPASRAEDAVQQAFLNAYEALGRSDAPIELKPWLYRITHNASLNLLRQNGWDYDQIPADFDGVMRPDQAVDLGERLRSTVAAVKRLPDRQRDAIVLRELEGRSYEEIAAALGTGDGAVRQLLNRARAGLRTAATAITPWPLVARAAASPSGANIERAMEVAGAAGIVKVGVATIATAAVVGGGIAGPVDLTGREGAEPGVERANAAAPAGSPARREPSEPAADAPADAPERGERRERSSRDDARRGSGRRDGAGRRGSSGPGGGDDEGRAEEDSEDRRSGNSGPGGGADDDRAQPVDDDSREDGDDRSGSGGGEELAVDNSGSDDGVSDDTSDSSGPGSGDDDLIPTTEPGETVRVDNSGPGSSDSGEADDD